MKLFLLVFFLALSLPDSRALASAQSVFSLAPNSLGQISQRSVKSVAFGIDVLGILIPNSISDRCDCLLVWNGVNWNEDVYYATFGANVLAGSGFYRPYNHSSRAYSIEVDKAEWLKLRTFHQFYKAFKSKHFTTFSVIQLESPHAPFVYVETDLNGKHEVFRLETPQDLSPNIEAWLKEATVKEDDGARDKSMRLSLTYELYQTGTGKDPGVFAVHYQFRDGSWYAIRPE